MLPPETLWGIFCDDNHNLCTSLRLYDFALGGGGGGQGGAIDFAC